MSASVGSGVEVHVHYSIKIANENKVLVRIRVRVTLSSTVYMKGAGGRGSKLHLSWFVAVLSVNYPVNLCTVIITSIQITNQSSS